MNFRISDSTRANVKNITGHTCEEIVSMPLSEGVGVNVNQFSSFRNPHAKQIQSRGSVYLQMKRVAKLKDVSRRFFNF